MSLKISIAMDTTNWPQEFIVKPMNETTCLNQPNPPAAPVEKKARPEKDEALNCPRCNSLNTKFCYYNNYSLTQPRYFCKDCKRYWTQGGSLRNIPIGGGLRKSKRSSSSSSSNSNSSSSSKKTHLNSNKTPPPPQQPNLKTAENTHEVAAFSQGFGHHQSIPEFLQVVPNIMKTNNPLVSTSSALELLGISNSSTTSRPPFMTYPNVHDSSVYTAAAAAPGFGLGYPQFQDFMRPPLGFSLDGGEEGSSGTNNGRPLLTFESLKLHVSSSGTNSGGGNGNDHEREKEADNSVGFWNGMLRAGDSAASAGGPWQ